MKITLTEEGSKEATYLGGAITICWTKFVLGISISLITIAAALLVAYLFGYLAPALCIAIVALILKLGMPEIRTTKD